MTDYKLIEEQKKRLYSYLDFEYELDLTSISGREALVQSIAFFVAQEIQMAVEERQDAIDKKNHTINNMMDEIRYLRKSQPERRKPVVRIKSGDDWYIPMITQALDTPDGLYIEAELALTQETKEEEV